MKILCIGSATYDINLPVDTYPKENTSALINTKIECGGGTASNAAYLLAKWKMNSYFAGLIGRDENGLKILKEFNEVGVNTSYLELNKDVITPTSMILISTAKTRTILNYNPLNEHKYSMELDINPDVILMDGSEYETASKSLDENIDAISILDCRYLTKEVIELAKRSTYLIISEHFASKLADIKIEYTNPDSIINAYLYLKKIFKYSNIILVLDTKGCIYEDEGIKRMPAFKVDTKDITGSMDIFIGAFTYGISNGFEIEKSLKYAMVARALSLKKFGGRNSIPELNEVEDNYGALK